MRDDARSGDVLEWRDVLLRRDDDEGDEWRDVMLWRDEEDEAVVAVEVEVSVLLRVRGWRTGAGEARVRGVGEGVRGRCWRRRRESAISSRSSIVNAVVCSAATGACAGLKVAAVRDEDSGEARGSCCDGDEGEGKGAAFEAPM